MHLENYKASDVKRLQNEHERNEQYHDATGHIDKSKTRMNVCVCKDSMSDKLQNRLDSVSHSKRKDLNVISEWVITYPQDLPNDTQSLKRFFNTAIGVFEDRYGKENVVGIYLHRDETSPHLHFDFVPVKDGRVSAKAVCTRKELSECHKAMDEAMQREFGMKGLILNGRTRGGLTTQELKERTKREKALTTREKRISLKEREIAEREQELLEKENSFAKRQKASEEALRASQTAFEEQKAKELNEITKTQQQVNQIVSELTGFKEKLLAKAPDLRSKENVKKTFAPAESRQAKAQALVDKISKNNQDDKVTQFD